MNQSIPRIIFNFNDRCINGCPFCFLPYDGKGVGSIDEWRRVLKRISDFSPELVSFSGCDPLYYSDFYELLATEEKKTKWSIDSSLVYLDKDRFKKIANRIDLISTSIDDYPGMERKQRYSDRVFDTFCQNLDYVLTFKKNLIVHTLYSKLNADGLIQIADFLMNRNIKHWSLYQFWPYDFMTFDMKDYLCDDSEFREIGERLLSYCGQQIDFEYVLYKGRTNGYFFTSSRGDVYTSVVGNIGHYEKLGTIFDEDIYHKWLSQSNPEKAIYWLKRKIKRESE